MQRYDATEDGLALVPSCVVFRHDTGPDFYFHAEAKNACEDGAAGDAALQLVDFCARLVDIERANDNETGVGGEVTDGDGDFLHDVFVDGVDVVFQLGGNRNDGRRFGDGACRFGD